ncbi:NAD(P)-binding domain-containing protein [Arthrobacter sp. Sa2CUA1]|uniref:NAD(P)-binding domain-containing protein n=1 Tax=Arthrobacter gallicola TaxID=2762225 RepID=A0ABR8UXM7_9MICC|nr:NAD(P)-binding domain-containing protein [Arthrobacter gallicola]MBD7996856.1 NAD(P)-binding domain-containing protein [Arthrobacter gallicola]
MSQDRTSQSQSGQVRTVGVLGAGRVGTAVARQALKAGFNVKIATSRPAAENALLVEIITPGATAVDASDAAQADLVVVAVPLHRFRTLSPEALAGKTVIDAMNYWAPIDGTLADFEDGLRGSSEVVQDFLAGSNVVKTLNHIGYHDLEADGAAPGTPGRRALAVAGDDAAARASAADFINALGYDPVDAGPLAAGRGFQPGTPAFNGPHTASALRALLEEALAASPAG